MKKLIIAVAVFLVGFGANAQTADEIIAKHIEARGGAEKLKAIKTVVQSMNSSIMGMDLPTKMTIITNKAMKQEVEVMGQQIITCINDGKGWTINPMGGATEPTEIPAEMLDQAKGQTDITHGLVSYKEKGTVFELVGKEKVNGKDAFKLKKVSASGPAISYFFEADTYNLVKMLAVTGGVEVPISYSNFKAVDGVMFPFTMETEIPQAGAMTITTVKIELNLPVDEAIFKMPAK